jgi:amino acid adenylation domain-containing protein
MMLHELVTKSAVNTPLALAVSGPDGSLNYAELDSLANRIARALRALGVCVGDRVGIWLDKSTRALAAMQAILRLGAAYVPIDPTSPAARAFALITDCGMCALVTTGERAELVLQGNLKDVAFLTIDSSLTKGKSVNWQELTNFSPLPLDPAAISPYNLAYILYTSGSTGQPKGVCISHRNALAFIQWAADTFQATATDRFSSHAPFHFDLSVFDLYVPLLVGAAVYLLPEGIAYAPIRLVDFIDREQITVWYSVPSVLILMIEHGNLLALPRLPLRALTFAGEPFPIKYLRKLREHWPSLRLINMYGPTETNVCTFFEVTEIDPTRTTPVAIGRACSGDEVWAVKEDGKRAVVGEEGELMVTGPSVMLGYWGKLPQGDKPYATGDIVRVEEDNIYMYIGRRDHMVKLRGYRIELGDIEAALMQHSAISEAVVVVVGEGIEARLVAFLVSNSPSPPALLEIKRHCAERLPRYMIINEIHFLDKLPLTSTGKKDRQKLVAHLADINKIGGEDGSNRNI